MRLKRRRGTYQLKGELDFKEVPQLNPLVTQALAAANKGSKFYGTVAAEENGQTLTLYLKLNYKDGKPAEIEVGEVLPDARNVAEAAASLPAEYGTINVNTEQPLATAPLVLKR